MVRQRDWHPGLCQVEEDEMGRYIAFEYAIRECVSGDAYLTNCAHIGAILEAFDDCAGITLGCPPGVSEEEWEKHRTRWYDAWCRTTGPAASALWHDPGADFSLTLPWRPGFVVRAWRVPAAEARNWPEA